MKHETTTHNYSHYPTSWAGCYALPGVHQLTYNVEQNVLPNPFCLSLKHRQLLCTHIGKNLIPGTKIKRTDLIKKGIQHEN